MSGRTYGLIPGAGGQAWYWHRVVPLLAAQGHHPIAIDLPGSAPADGLSEYTDVVVEALAGRENVVLVAQSMGGLTAPLVCDRRPVDKIVLVNAMIPAPGETGGDWWTNSGQSEAQRNLTVGDGRDPDGPFDPDVLFLHDVPPEVLDGAPEPADQSGTPFGEPWPRGSWPDVPTRVLCGRDDRLFPAGFQERIARERLGLTAETLPGGHLVALSRPDELVALLLRP